MCVHDGLADRQTEPVAGHRGAPYGTATEEWLENALAIAGRNAPTSIDDRELQLAALSDASGDDDCAARRRVFERVLDQVGEDAFHLTCIHSNAW